MNRILSLALGAFLMIGAAPRASDSPFVGEWKLDPSRTKITDEMKVENVSGNKYSFDLGGGAETIVVDGTDQPGAGGTTLSVNVEENGSWKVVRKKDGRLLLTAIWDLAKDGTTLMDNFTSIGPDGAGSTVHNLYQRTAGTSGFAGTWECPNLRTSSVFLLEVQPFEGDGLSFIYPSQEITRNVKFDGKDYPTAGANAPSGSFSSARRVNKRTLEMTNTYNGTTLDTRQIDVSSNGKTLTMAVRKARQHQPSILVFERQ